MKNILFTTTLFLISLVLFMACDTPDKQRTADLNTKIDSVSYSIGYLQGMGLAQEGVTELDINNFVAGMQKAFRGEDSDMDNFAMQMVIQEYLSDMQVAQSVRRSQQAEANKAEAERYLAENAERDDVMVTESGLQYRVIEEGTGDRPEASDEVEVHYRGTLVSGEEFDSSHSRNQTATFPLNRVISGWTEGLQLMTVGSTYEFFIPAELGYGDNPPQGSIIEPGAVLIFEVELIDIK
jgi:FKBP-type peptidyl-prolyl cis-trans isomerase